MIGPAASILAATLLAAMAPAPRDAWPELPTSGFVSGRAATEADVAAGNAAFSLQGAGRPLALAIPQYAIWRSEDGARVPVIVVQAEAAPDGAEIIGLRKPDGSEIVATRAEVTLLGTERPR